MIRRLLKAQVPLRAEGYQLARRRPGVRKALPNRAHFFVYHARGLPRGSR